MVRIIRGKTRGLTNKELDKVFDFLHISKNEIFCDLGSAKGHAVFRASKTVETAYGIEMHSKDFLKSQRLQKKQKINNIKLIYGNYENRKILNKVSNSSIVYCSNDLPLSFMGLFEKIFKPKTLLITLGYPPYPIKPKFFIPEDFNVIEIPFKLAKTPNEWASGIIGKKATMKDVYTQIKKNYKPEFALEMIDELKEQSISYHWLIKKYRNLN